MYAALKIEKTVGKGISTHPDEDDLDIEKGGYYGRNSSTDHLFENAMANIENFKETTSNLERKINVLVVETDHRHRSHHNHSEERPHNLDIHKHLNNISKQT